MAHGGPGGPPWAINYGKRDALERCSSACELDPIVMRFDDLPFRLSHLCCGLLEILFAMHLVRLRPSLANLHCKLFSRGSRVSS